MSSWHDDVESAHFYFQRYLSDAEERDFFEFWTYCEVLADQMCQMTGEVGKPRKFEDLPSWNKDLILAYAAGSWNLRRAHLLDDAINKALDVDRDVSYWRFKVEPLKEELRRLKRREADRKRAKAKKATKAKKEAR